jgi:hypothetical protein
LGQLSECANPAYWDSIQGDPIEAAEGADTAFLLTEANFPEECDNMPTYRYKAFRARLNSDVSVPAGVWTLLNFDSITWWTNTGSPNENSGYEVTYGGHSFIEGFHGSVEFWLYQIKLRASSMWSGNARLRLTIPSYPQPEIYARDQTSMEMTTIHRSIGESNIIQPEIILPQAKDILSGEHYTEFSGVLVGRIE